jgi:hypothetical protein
MEEQYQPCVSADQLIAAERAERYKRQLERPDKFPDGANWQYIIENKMALIGRELYRKYLVSWLTPQPERCDYHELALQRFGEYLCAIEREDAVDIVYSDITSAPEATKGLIADCNLFDAMRLYKILNDGDANFVVECLDTFQPKYTANDLRNMQRLSLAIDNLEPLGEMRDARSIFGREVKYICPEGHTNSAQQEFCATCGLNIHGFNGEQVAMIRDFKSRIATLSRLLSKSKPVSY